MKTKKISKHTLPGSEKGCEEYIISMDYGPDIFQKKVYIQAGLHADETPGYLVLHHLIQMLDKADETGKIKERIAIVPAANPIGLNQWTRDRLDGRFHSFTGINFNRNFPELIKPISEIIKDRLTQDSEKNVEIIREAIKNSLSNQKPVDEAEHLKKMLFSLAYDADIVMDLHCDSQALFHVYSGTPLWHGVEKMSERLGAEVCLVADDSGVNPFDEACGKIWWILKDMFPDYPIPLACLAATIELRGQADVSYDICKKDAENVFNYLIDQNIIDGHAPVTQKLKRNAAPLNGVEYIFSDAFGVVAFLKNLGDIVQKGEVVAEVIKMNEMDAAKKMSRLRASTSGVLFTLVSDKIAKPGKLLAKISGDQSLKPEGEGLLSP